MVRSARRDDIPAIISMFGDLAIEDGSGTRADVTVTEVDLRCAVFDDPPALNVLIAELQGQRVGCAAWFPTYTPWTGKRAVWLADIYVMPPFRRQGLGSEMMSALTDHCIRDGYHRIDWKMEASNLAATAFYTALGATGPKGRVTWTLETPAR